MKGIIPIKCYVIECDKKCFLVERMERLTPKQLNITVDIINKLLEAFALSENSN